MTFNEIITALHSGKCEATADALQRAIDDEARALAELPGGKWKKRDGGKFAREAARDFYATDITNQLTDPVQPTPTRMLSHRRFPVTWAVAEVLRTNGLAPTAPLKTLAQFEAAAVAAAERGDYSQAARYFDEAAGLALGHKRGDGLKHAADEMREKAAVQS